MVDYLRRGALPLFLRGGTGCLEWIVEEHR